MKNNCPACLAITKGKIRPGVLCDSCLSSGSVIDNYDWLKIQQNNFSHIRMYVCGFPVFLILTAVIRSQTIGYDFSSFFFGICCL